MKSEERRFPNCRFQAETVKNAIETFDRELKDENSTRLSLLTATIDDTERGHDDEAEFFADYRKCPDNVTYKRDVVSKDSAVIAEMKFRTHSSPSFPPTAIVEVHADKWPQILAVMEVFESDKDRAALPVPKEEPPVIFLGHGRSESWKQLRDHLQDKHGFKIEAYEIGARAGHAIRDILQSMLAKSSIAFLVMTGEDAMQSGHLHPRLNVVHEAGLFQGRLGFNRAIVLLEEGTTEFSNIHGIEQVRFANIKEVFGDVVATIRREFPNP
jgi:CAP12/Pycsar effector protein, TIR domain